MRRIFLCILVIFSALQMKAQAPAAENKNQRYFDINKNIDIFNSVLRELDMFYVYSE